MKLNPNNPQEFTMTIEERPNIQHDWNAEYKKQRKDRLTDAIHDYLDDSEVDVSEFYNDMRDIIVEMNTYHKTFAKKAEAALLLLHGKPVVENDDDVIFPAWSFLLNTSLRLIIMTEEELKQVIDNLLQVQSNNEYNFQLLQARIDMLQKQIDDLDELREIFRLPKPENQNRDAFEQINWWHLYKELK